MSIQYRFIRAYGHGHRIGVLVEFGVQSEFTARMPEVIALSSDIAMQIAGFDPADVEDLLDQPLGKDTSLLVRQHIATLSEQLREPIEITRFVRWDNQSADPDEPPGRHAAAMKLVRNK